MHGRMFHRRLGLLAGAGGTVIVVLFAQLSRLAVVEGAERRAAAERRLNLVTYLPTTRGRILDRHGRELAVDRPAYDVAVDYDVITGNWALERAAWAARRARGERWLEMGPAERDAAVAEFLPGYEQQVERLWDAVRRLGGLEAGQLAQRLDAVKRDVERTAAVVWDRRLREEIRYGRGDGAEFRPRPIREQEEAHVILPRVDDEVAFAFRRLAADLPGLHVLNAHRRAYPWTTAEVKLDRSSLPRPLRSTEPLTVRVTGVADHILGSMRHEVWAADVRRRPFRDPETGATDLGGYRVGDTVGSRGLERSFEDHLRGRRGVLRKNLDTGDVSRTPHEPGDDLRVSLDVALQSRVQAILSPAFGLAVVQQYQAGWGAGGEPRDTALPLGTPLNGAAVVLDVETGEILALVSMPTRAAGRALPEACRARHQPLVNRPVQAIYPPGSIAKPLVLAAAVTEGVCALDETIECVGHYLPGRRDIVRCWIYRPPRYGMHGELAAADAIARSCNIFFYTLGDRLGMTRLAAWYRRFGLGGPLDVGLRYRDTTPDGDVVWRGESAGGVPTAEDVAALEAAGERHFASLILGIGQGPLTWTPVHAASAYATLARGGKRHSPTLVPGRQGADDDRGPDLPELADELIETILEGLRASIEESYGTGNHITYRDGTREPIINVAAVRAWAKTGTAQAPPADFDLDCDGTPDVHLDDASHAWFVGLVGPREGAPRYAVSVIVEYGGSGGRTAGPVANEIIRALQAEGYLPESSS